MNIITDTLPESVEFDGNIYPVKTDFKVWLKFHSIITDTNKTPAERTTEAILCCFDAEKCRKLPKTAYEAIEVLMRFYSAGCDTGCEKNPAGGKKVFDFTEDCNYIYAAFFQDYGIDLSQISMHWYRFLALLNGLSENTQLRKIIAWRSINLSDVKDEKLRGFYRRMQKFYRLKCNMAHVLDAEKTAEELSRAF